MGDFLGGPVVKNLPFSTGDVGSIPGWGTKILHVTGQLSPCAAMKIQCSQNKTSELKNNKQYFFFLIEMFRLFFKVYLDAKMSGRNTSKEAEKSN